MGDARTANVAGVGIHKTDTLKAHAHDSPAGTGAGGSKLFNSSDVGGFVPGSFTGSTGTSETAPKHTRVAAVILV